MFEFIGSAVVIYFIFRFLDCVFRPKQEKHGQQFAIQDYKGDWYIVEENEQADLPPAKLPDNMVRFKLGGHHG